MALPWVEVGGPRWPIQPYGMFVLAGLVAGAAIAARCARRFAVPIGEVIGLAAVAAFAAAIAGHVFDVAWYQWDAAGRHPGLWFAVSNGHSLFGALLGVAVVGWLWTRARWLDGALYADLLAVGAAVALAIGRIGCALVHDHLGTPTTLPIGVDVPWRRVPHLFLHQAVPTGDTIRLHDVGLYELAVAIVLAIAAGWWIRRRSRAGLVAARLAIAYAGARFALDFLRAPDVELTRAGLTAGQWSSIVMVAIAAIAIRRIARTGHVAPLASELDGRPGGMRRVQPPAAELPRATLR